MTTNDPSQAGNSSQTSPVRETVFRTMVHALATQFAAERTVHSIRMTTRIVTFLGILQPLLVGGYYLRFGDGPVPVFMKLAVGVLSLLLLVLSAWSIIDKWDDQYSHSVESSSANRRCAERLRAILDLPSLPEAEVQSRLETAVNDIQYLSSRDAVAFRLWERRRGHRCALRHLQIVCATCKQQPLDMSSSSCETCGCFNLLDRLPWR